MTARAGGAAGAGAATRAGAVRVGVVSAARAGAVRVGVVGAGSMGREHLAALAELGVSAAVFSPSGRAAGLASEYDATLHQTLSDLIEHCEVVDICSPTDTHLAIARQAFAAGRDVICEKPLARTAEDAAALIEAARSAGRAAHIAQVVRYFTVYATAHDEALAGRIGQPRELALSRTGPAPQSAWFFDEERSGGVLMDQMIHDFDYARWTLGEVGTVQAQVHHETAAGGAPVVRASATLHHESGAVSHLTGGWLGPERSFATSLALAGEAGMLRHTSGAALELVAAGGRPTTLLTPAEIAADRPYAAQLAEFLAAIDGGRAARVSPEDGLAAVQLTLAARRSAALGEAVRLRVPS